VTGYHPVERLEGDWQPFGITVVEFESAERIREWYTSDRYRELIRMREGAGRVEIFIVEGHKRPFVSASSCRALRNEDDNGLSCFMGY